MNKESAHKLFFIANELDFAGDFPLGVELGYREAIANDPSNAKYHGSFLCFLVTTGRMLDAEAQWLKAIKVIVREDDTYNVLHRKLARLLLHRSELDMARRVLNDVPQSNQLEWFHNIAKYSNALKKYVEIGISVRDFVELDNIVPAPDRYLRNSLGLW